MNPCPNCKSNNVSLHTASNVYWIVLHGAHMVQCDMCKMRGPSKHTKDAAIDAWNELPRSEQESTGRNFDEWWEQYQINEALNDKGLAHDAWNAAMKNVASDPKTVYYGELSEDPTQFVLVLRDDHRAYQYVTSILEHFH